MNLIYVNRTAGDLIQHGTRLKKPQAILEHQRDRKTYARMFPEIEPVWEMNFGAFRYHGILVAIWTPGGSKGATKMHQEDTERTERVPGGAKWYETALRHSKKLARVYHKGRQMESKGSQGGAKNADISFIL